MGSIYERKIPKKENCSKIRKKSREKFQNTKEKSEFLTESLKLWKGRIRKILKFIQNIKIPKFCLNISRNVIRKNGIIAIFSHFYAIFIFGIFFHFCTICLFLRHFAIFQHFATLCNKHPFSQCILYFFPH